MADRATNTKLSNTSDLEINPATEDKQDDIITAINQSPEFLVEVAKGNIA